MKIKEFILQFIADFCSAILRRMNFRRYSFDLLHTQDNQIPNHFKLPSFFFTLISNKNFYNVVILDHQNISFYDEIISRFGINNINFFIVGADSNLVYKNSTIFVSYYEMNNEIFKINLSSPLNFKFYYFLPLNNSIEYINNIFSSPISRFYNLVKIFIIDNKLDFESKSLISKYCHAYSLILTGSDLSGLNCIDITRLGFDNFDPNFIIESPVEQHLGLFNV